MEGEKTWGTGKQKAKANNPSQGYGEAKGNEFRKEDGEARTPKMPSGWKRHGAKDGGKTQGKDMGQ